MTLQFRLAILLVIGIFISGLCWKSYTAGKHVVQAEWDAEKVKQLKAAEEARIMKEEGIANAAGRFAVTDQKNKIVERNILVKVPEYVSSNDCPLSPGFRVLYDAAVTGTEIDDSAIPHAAAVPVTDAASTTVQNFAACRYDQERLRALQEIVKVLNR